VPAAPVAVTGPPAARRPQTCTTSTRASSPSPTDTTNAPNISALSASVSAQRFPLDEVLVRPHGLQHRVATGDRHGDTVGDVEPGLAAGLLDTPDDIASQTLGPQLGRELGVEGDRDPTLGTHDPARPRYLGHEHVVRADRDRLAVDRDRRAALVAQPFDQRSRRFGLDRLGDDPGPAAEALAQLPEVGLDGHVDHRGAGFQRCQTLDVQLVGDVVQQCGGHLGLGRQPDEGVSQRLADLDLARLPRGAAGLREGPCRLDLRRQLRIEQVGVRGGPVGQVDRLGCVRAAGADDPLPHLLRDERHDRGQQPGEDFYRLVEGDERVLVATGEPLPVAAHVPVGQVVDELRQQPAGTGRVVVLQPVVHSADQGVYLGEDPPVEQRSRCGRAGRLRAPRGVAGVEGEERHGVPVGHQDLPDDLLQ